jgi:hypothetical protein
MLYAIQSDFVRLRTLAINIFKDLLNHLKVPKCEILMSWILMICL